MRTICCLLAVFVLLSIPSGAVQIDVPVSAVSAILVDAESGAVLYEKNADAPSLIASTTKIMTGYLACRLCDLDAEITVPKEAVGIEGSSVYLREGQKIRLRALLLGTMLESGNDAAAALAIAAAGSETRFVSLMNETARTLGLRSTHFANPHGLDSAENHSTARELALLASVALRDPDFAEAVGTKTACLDGQYYVNHNKLLWRLDGAIGVKTGFTKAAGRILVSAVRRDGRTLVAVTINAPDDWNDHERLYRAAFQN